MEVHPTPFPVKSQCMKPKSTRKISEASNVGAPLTREKRVFGTARNPNIPEKAATGKPGKHKPSSGLLKQAAKTSPETRSPLSGHPISRTKNSSENNPKKKNVRFQEKEVARNGKFSRDENVLEPQTPLKSPVVSAKPRLSATPYRSAEKCRLETSAYWLGQIKLAESVGKHSVSAAFFQLAFECKAEPIRNIRVELKKYLSRHEYLNMEEVWRKVSLSYGLVKEGSSQDEGNGKIDDEEANGSVVDNQEDKDLQKESGEGNENLDGS
ncbi:hypothetical protein Salat_0411000 [Sesamum alatum]|uniref:Uncharacterized protein n=1 Tax=Sesamum alatum TaxID=300844 RepID=A0AAE1Z3G6_9LAMI|nr:hypothetical protein Salat_0411000 [Sesamum alatum]